jgi:acyl carrier protein
LTAAPVETVRTFILTRLEEELAANGLTPRETPEDYDLLLEGVIDSFGIVELITEIEDRFDVMLDLEELDPDVITVIGPLSTYVARLIEEQR